MIRTGIRGAAFPLLLLLLVLILPACVGEEIPTSTVPLDAADIDRLLQAAVDRGVARGLVAAVVDREGVVYVAAFGEGDAANHRPMETDSIFRMMSMTKPIVSVAAMMLYEDGAFELDDAIADYLPSEADRHVIDSFNLDDGTYTTTAPESPVTLRQVFTHTSGAGYDFSSPELARLREVTGEDPGRFPLIYQPGTRWNYSVSTDRLGELIEVVTGQPLPGFLETRIFAPLGMEDTFYAVPAGKAARVVTTHQREADGSPSEVPNPAELQSPPRGRTGLFSTALDYARFLEMLLNDGQGPEARILDPDTVALMTRNHIDGLTVVAQIGSDPAVSSPFPINSGLDHFGLGFQIAVPEVGDLRFPGSYSWSGLYNTHFWVDPTRGLAGILLVQLLPFYDDQVMALFGDFEILVNQSFAD
jgi:CubicO group peptidase (beta-lactamase class C family)